MPVLLVATCLATLLSLPSPPPPTSQQAPAYGVMVMAHGGNEEWNRQIRSAVAAVDTDLPVAIAFGMADRASLVAAVADLEARGVRNIAVVRLFVSGESFRHQADYLLGLTSDVPDTLFDSDRVGGMRPVPDPAKVSPIAHESDIALSITGLVESPFTGEILAERALRLSDHPEHETVLVIAHGMGDEAANERLLRALHARAESIRTAAPFRAVEVATLREDWDDQRAVAEARIRDIVTRGAHDDGRVIVIPFRVAGFGPYAEVLEGLEYRADGTGLLPHDGMVEWILRSARQVACEQGWTDAACPAAP